MEIYRDEAFWKDYYEKNRQYVGNNRKIKKHRILKDRSLYENNAHAMAELAAGTYDRITPEQFAWRFGKKVQVSDPGKLIFHAYWCGDIGEKQAFSLASCIATQLSENTEIWLWLDAEKGYEGCQDNAWLKPLLPFIRVLPYDADKEIEGTPFADKAWLFRGPELTNRADGFRILELWKRGGVYFDLDVLFLKDLRPVLAVGECCYAWEQQAYANNALLYLKADSKLSRHIAQKAIGLETFRPWRLFQYGDPDLADYIVYPSAFFDPLWMKKKEDPGPVKDFASFFTEPADLAEDVTLAEQQVFPGAYAHHWHNQWRTQAHENSAYRWFYRKIYEEIRKRSLMP